MRASRPTVRRPQVPGSIGDGVAHPSCGARGSAGIAGAAGAGAGVPAIDIRLRLAGAAVPLPPALRQPLSTRLGRRGGPAPRSRRHLSHLVRAPVRRLLFPNQQRCDPEQLRPRRRRLQRQLRRRGPALLSSQRRRRRRQHGRPDRPGLQRAPQRVQVSPEPGAELPLPAAAVVGLRAAAPSRLRAGHVPDNPAPPRVATMEPQPAEAEDPRVVQQPPPIVREDYPAWPSPRWGNAGAPRSRYIPPYRY
jgi:hypothetical protein